MNDQLTIDVAHLKKSYNNIPAVCDLSLCIPKGTIFGFLGPNGSGKTTSIRMLCGLIKPDSGAGECLGFDLLKQADEIHSKVGYMPQQFSLYANLTVRENLDFVARIYGIKNRKQRVDETIHSFDFQERDNQLTRTLSGGWKQRLALASCMLHKPSLLLLDEPTSGVDPYSRIQIWEKIQDIVSSGVSVLMSSHHMDEAERCHNLIYIAYGNVLTQGNTKDVIKASGLNTWIITGDSLSALSATLKLNKDIQVIEKGYELRVSSNNKEALRTHISNIGSSYHATESNPSLEDVFINLLTSTLATNQ